MSKTPIPFSAPDLSLFARKLAQELSQQDSQPSHLSLMNILARSAGYQNYQHIRASQTAQARIETTSSVQNTDFRLVERALHQFDIEGLLVRWPSRRPVQELCLWILWSSLPSAEYLHEKEVNALLNGVHLFGDAALLRRSLLGLGLVTRNRDGSNYQRQEKQPPAEALELLSRVKTRRQAAGSAIPGTAADVPSSG